MQHNKDYPGEVPAKKMTRLTFWLLVRQHLGTKRFLAGPHLVLASREAGDVSVLLGMGVDIKNIVSVEWKPHEAAGAQLKFPDLLVVQKDVAQFALHRGEPFFASAYLDFCCQSGADAFERVAMVARSAMQEDALIGYNFMVGREQGMRHAAAKYRKEIEEQISRMKKARRTDMEDMAGYFSRAFLMEKEIIKRAKATRLKLVANFFYSSRQVQWKGDPHGHPWCGQLMLVDPASTRKVAEPPCYYFTTDATALREYALALEKKTGQAALLLNVTRTTMAAWKAHASRGTYSRPS